MRRSFSANSKCKNCELKDPLVRNNHYDENSKLYKSITELLDKLNNNINELSPTIKKLGQKSNSLVFSGSDDKDAEPSVR